MRTLALLLLLVFVVLGKYPTEIWGDDSLLGVIKTDSSKSVLMVDSKLSFSTIRIRPLKDDTMRIKLIEINDSIVLDSFSKLKIITVTQSNPLSPQIRISTKDDILLIKTWSILIPDGFLYYVSLPIPECVIRKIVITFDCPTLLKKSYKVRCIPNSGSHVYVDLSGRKPLVKGDNRIFVRRKQ